MFTVYHFPPCNALKNEMNRIEKEARSKIYDGEILIFHLHSWQIDFYLMQCFIKNVFNKQNARHFNVSLYSVVYG